MAILETLKSVLNEWLHYYNNARMYSEKICCGWTSTEALLDNKHIWPERNLSQM